MLRRRPAMRGVSAPDSQESFTPSRLKNASRPAARRTLSDLRAFIEPLEARVLLSAAHDITGLTAMRNDPNFSSITGSGIGIAILDSGVFAQNPDLQPNIVAYFNAVTQRFTAPLDPNFLADAKDTEGHGTHVSGIAAATDPNIGVATQAHLVEVHVLPGANEIQAVADPVLNGLEFVALHAKQFNIKVVNLSLGSIFPANVNATPALDQEGAEIKVLESMDITVVAASGNSYADFAPAPGEGVLAAQATIGVADTWPDTGLGEFNFTEPLGGSPFDTFFEFENSAQPDILQAFSQRSTLFNQVAAPGAAILSTWNSPTQLFNRLSGTSMAAPFVTGTVALMQQAAFKFGGRFLDPSDVLTILRNTSDQIVDSNVTTNGRINLSTGQVSDLPETGFTYDRVNVYKAIQAVKAFVQGGGINTDSNNKISDAITTPALNGANTISETGNIGADGTNVIGVNDVDVYKLVVQTPGTLAITSQAPAGGTQFNESLELFDPSGNVVLSANGGGGTPYPPLLSPLGTFLAAGTYYLGVSSASNINYNIVNGTGATGGGSQGDYQLSITVQSPDPGGVPVAAQTLALTNPTTLTPPAVAPNIPFTEESGIIGEEVAPDGTTVAVPDGDVHFYTLVAPDTGNLILQSDNTVSNGQAVIRVLDQNSNTIGSIGTNLTVPVTIGQTYYVTVTTPANQNFAPNDPFSRVVNSTAALTPFDIFVGFDNGDKNGTVADATTAAIGTPVSGAIGSDPGGGFLGANGGNKDVDFYSFTASTAGVMQFAVSGISGFAPQMSLWTSTSGFGVVQNLAGTTTSNLTLYQQVTAGQQVVVAVTGQGNQNFNGLTLGSGAGGQIGSYTLNSTLQPLSALATLSNNSINNATPTPVTLAQSLTGNIGLDGSLFVGSTDVDIYAFTAPSTREYSFSTLTQQENSAQTVIRVFDGLGNQIAVSTPLSSTTTSNSVSVAMLAGQTFYIGVSGAGPGQYAYNPLTGAAAAPGSTGPYSFSVADAGPFQTRVNFQEGKKFSFIDASGHKITATLRGPGTGTAVFFSTSSNHTDLGELDFTGTDTTTNVTIHGATPLPKVNITNGMGTFNAQQDALTGDMTVGAGIKKLTLASASGGTITIGAGSALSLSINKVSDEALTSSEPIKQIKVGQWTTSGATRFQITAPSIGSIMANGTFDEDVSTNVLTKASIGTLTASAIRAATTIGSFTAGSAADSLIFAGAQPSLVALPTSVSDLANVQTASISSVNIKGTFSDTQIASWKIGKVMLSSIKTANNGKQFGIAGNSIKQVRATVNGASKVFSNLFSPLPDTSLGGDALIRLIG